MSEEDNNTNGDNSLDERKRQNTMDFILEHQAKFSVDIDKLTSDVGQLTNSVSRLERIVKMVVVAGRKVRSEFRESQNEIKEMRETMREQDKRITVIIDTNHELQNLARQNMSAIKEIGNKLDHLTDKLDRLTDVVIVHVQDPNAHKS